MSLDVVFMGTPDFAVPCLEALAKDENYNIKQVISQPDRRQGRGYKLVPTDVKKTAMKYNLDVYQPESIKAPEALENLKKINPDVIVVVAYGQILPKEMLDLPELGCINVHASLLPELRGAGPIQWSIINGDTETGVTTMHMDVGMDTGDIILQTKTDIGAQETGGELFKRLADLGAELLLETLPKLKDGSAPRTAQDSSLATYAPMIKKSMAELNFDYSPEEFCNRVRGFHPWPLAFTFCKKERVIIHKAETVSNYSGEPGEVLDAQELIIACGDGAVKLVEVQPQGGKIMNGTDFANGRRLKSGEKFNSL